MGTHSPPFRRGCRLARLPWGRDHPDSNSEAQMDGQSLGEARRGLWFNLTVDAAHDLARDTDRVGALLTVEAEQSEGSPAAVAGIAEILIMDRSQSMIREGKLPQAKRAVAPAIDTLADGAYFAVIAGNHTAEEVC